MEHQARLTKKEIEVWLAEKMAEEVGIPAYEIDPEAPYVQYGVDSAVAVTLSGDLSQMLGQQLAPTLLWDYPTIAELADYLVNDFLAESHQSAPDVQAMEEHSSDPIAIIGIGCRFPGGADKPEAFWNLLHSGTDAISEVPAERWSLDRYYSDDEESVGTMKTRFGGFVDGIDQLDAQFFGLSPREAERMDPQQRLLLEVAHEALEDAGQVVERLAGSKVGVFVGISTNDYGHANLTRTDWSEVYAATGNASSIASNRLSYVFDFQGPSISFDTACSSSLTAVHVASRSLREGECEMALVGGVNVLLMPEISVGFSQAGMLAPDGRCKTFDASANGYVRSEGAGMVVLKRLSRALADGDDIYAVIAGSAINQDGRSNGLTAPNRLAQEQVLREAYRSAGVQPHEVQYVEAHGTGTPLGDPIEAGALGKVLGQERGDGVLRVGSVKSNIGHTEAAAGIAGLIKLALSLKKGIIPPTLHFNNWNPLIPAEELKLAVPQSPEPWHDAERVVAGVSSFGFGGTNVHVVLEQLRTEGSSMAEASDEESFEMVTLSAKNEEALGDQAGRLLHFLTEDAAGSAADLRQIANTTRLRRSHFDHRLAILAADKQELIRELEGYRNGEASPNVIAGRKKRGGAASQPVFLFCGQGPQWYAMGRELLRTEPVFRQKFEEIDQLFADYQDWSLIEELHKEESESRIHETDFTQTLLFAVQASLAALWRSWGIEPAAVIGHSAGEVAAAHVAGALDLANAVRVMYHRARLIKRTEGKGRPAAVELPKEDVLKYLSGYEDRIDVAASNSPRSCVIAGDEEALQAVVSRIEADGVFCRFVKITFASHSRQMEPILSELSLVLQGMTVQDTSVPMYSTVTGDVIEGRKMTAAYWRRNVREMVRFDEAVQRVMAEGCNLFVEISPHPVLEGSVLECAAGQEVLVLPSLRRREGERRILLQTLARMYATGYPMAANALDASKPWVRLPSYPWQKERFWLDAVQGESERRVTGAGLTDEQAGWLYDMRWEMQERTTPSDAKKQANGPGRWLILADEQGLGEQLAQRFEASGDSVVMVRHGESFECLSERSYVIRPSVTEDWSRLADSAQEATGLIHLWSLDSTLAADGTIEALQQSQALGVHSLLHAMQTGRSRVWVVTHGANAVGDLQVAQFEQTSMWGLGQTISIEMPQRWGGLIDLDPQTAPVEQAGSIVDELLVSAGEDRVAFRSGQRYAARLTPLSLADLPSNPWPLQDNATYLITGGLGDLGLLFARWMAEKGARRLILMGRTPMPSRTEWADLEPTGRMAERVRVIRELEAMGVTVTLAAVDVTQEAQLNGFLEQYRREGWPPIRGVMHAGGLVEERALTESTPADLDRIMRPKTEGAWLLHRAFAEEALDFFVMFSSISVILQSPRLGSYAAGNAFLDGLAAYRRSLGLPALSINWGAWGEVGMLAREDRDASKGASGLKPMPPQELLAVMEQFMRRDLTQAAVMDMVW
ncbi:MAG: beta-ketoacyl synthase N-terminal-like domain-containing protein, partial [Tumebacillaceae bacterium]